MRERTELAITSVMAKIAAEALRFTWRENSVLISGFPGGSL